jgi:hypothetical protein
LVFFLDFFDLVLSISVLWIGLFGGCLDGNGVAVRGAMLEVLFEGR